MSRRRYKGPLILTLGHIWNTYDEHVKKGRTHDEAVTATEETYSYCDGGKGLPVGHVAEVVAFRHQVIKPVPPDTSLNVR